MFFFSALMRHQEENLRDSYFYLNSFLQQISDGSFEYINLCSVIMSYLPPVLKPNQFVDHFDTIKCFCVSNDGQYILTCDERLSFLRWIYNGKIIHTLNTHDTFYCDISSKNEFILSADFSCTAIKIWSFATGECYRTIDIPGANELYECFFVRDDNVLTTHGEKTVHIWSVKNGECIQTTNSQWAKTI